MSPDRYVAVVSLDETAGLFHGEVVDTRAVLTFQGRSFDELRTAFRDTLDDCAAWCAERGEAPARRRRLTPAPHERAGRRRG